MRILGCDGELSANEITGDPSCSGDWLSLSASELATKANTMSYEDFQVIAGYFVAWFALAFGVKLIRRMFNT